MLINFFEKHFSLMIGGFFTIMMIALAIGDNFLQNFVWTQYVQEISEKFFKNILTFLLIQYIISTTNKDEVYKNVRTYHQNN